jgi:hypothetical protein
MKIFFLAISIASMALIGSLLAESAIKSLGHAKIVRSEALNDISNV